LARSRRPTACRANHQILSSPDSKNIPAVKGGLEVVAERGGDAIIIANAAVVVSLDDCALG
jgi:hypothetical protein